MPSKRLNAEYLRLALQWLLVGAGWSVIGFRADCTWTPQWLSSTALLWAWSDEGTLVERFQTARKIALFRCPPPSDPAGSYQAFTKLLRQWTGALVVVLRTALRRWMEQSLAVCWRVGGFVMFGVDGRRVDLPRTVAHETAEGRCRIHRGAESLSESSRMTIRLQTAERHELRCFCHPCFCRFLTERGRKMSGGKRAQNRASVTRQPVGTTRSLPKSRT